MPCDPLFADAFLFPRQLHNRPGLPRIDYRIGVYADFVEAMTRRIDAAAPLADWTHRRPDDPAIALLEGAAIVGDVLTFYQEHYANEVFLRTAAWRDSVADLVRLLGYRLSPGIGGRATFAVEARKPVTLRVGFPIKATLADIASAAEFETEAELVAYPHLSRFNLYRERNYALSIAGAQSRFEIDAVGGATDSTSLEAVELKKGDKLALIPEETVLHFFVQMLLGWPVDTPMEEIVVVEKVERARGRVMVTIAGTLSHGWLSHCRAFKLGRTFRHFGANAPSQFVQVTTTGSTTTTTSTATPFTRGLRTTISHGAAYSSFDAGTFPLDQEVTDIALGATVLITGRYVEVGTLPFAVRRVVRSLRGAVPQWGNLSGPSSLLGLATVIAPAWGQVAAPTADIRDLRLHETVGPALLLRPVATHPAGAFANGTNALRYYGSAEDVRAIAGRRLAMRHDDGREVELVCTNTPDNFATPSPNAPRMWPLSFDRAPTPFTRADFDESAPTITIFGNLVDASQGKSEREAILGNGDARQSYQTFPLPKAPLTYFVSPGATPPETPELEVFVNRRLWERVDSLFGHGPKEEIYIVREDAEGRSYVQFGDGETGARLPSGVRNVTARYRTGSGAYGPLAEGAVPSAGERADGLDKLTLAGLVSGGAERESGDKAREAAPGKVQSLGRLVSIRDFETEMLAIPGVSTASAAWAMHAGIPAVMLRVLLEAGREAEFAAVRATIARYQRCRGPDRFPIVVEQALLRYVFLDVTYARDGSFRQDDVEAAIRSALGLAGVDADARTGVFGLRARRLGEAEYASRIEGRVQQVPGVLWCRATSLGLFPAGATNPDVLVAPPPPRPHLALVAAAPAELLQLIERHLALTSVAAPPGECV